MVPEPYDSFMRCHLRYYGYFQGEPGAVPPRFIPWGVGFPRWGSSTTLTPGKKTGGKQSPVSPRGHSECHHAEAPGLGSAGPGCRQRVGKEPSCE